MYQTPKACFKDPGSDSPVFDLPFLLRFASRCLPLSLSAWWDGAGQLAGESLFSTLQVINKSQNITLLLYACPKSGFGCKSRNCRFPKATKSRNSLFPIADRQLAYEAKERTRLRVERQEESLQNVLRRKPEKLDVMSLEPRSSF